MQVTERDSGGLVRLMRLARREKDADQKDRSLCVVHARHGEETERIQSMRVRGRGSVQRWACADRDGGVAPLKKKPRPGREPSEPVRRRINEPHRLLLPHTSGRTFARPDRGDTRYGHPPSAGARLGRGSSPGSPNCAERPLSAPCRGATHSPSLVQSVRT